MPSNAKLARQAEEKAKKEDELKTRFTTGFYLAKIAPVITPHAHRNFPPRDAEILLNKFKVKAVEYLKKKLKPDGGVDELNFRATKTGLVCEVGEEAVISVQLDSVCFAREEQLDYIRRVIADRDKKSNENCFTYHRYRQSVITLDNEALTNQMKDYRSSRKNGDLMMEAENNLQFEVDGRTLYTAVITPLDDVGDVATSADPLGLGVGLLVDGWVYWFYHERNRDAFYKYIMGVK
jgi:hypothetical protein